MCWLAEDGVEEAGQEFLPRLGVETHNSCYRKAWERETELGSALLALVRTKKVLDLGDSAKWFLLLLLLSKPFELFLLAHLPLPYANWNPPRTPRS